MKKARPLETSRSIHCDCIYISLAPLAWTEETHSSAVCLVDVISVVFIPPVSVPLVAPRSLAPRG